MVACGSVGSRGHGARPLERAPGFPGVGSDEEGLVQLEEGGSDWRPPVHPGVEDRPGARRRHLWLSWGCDRVVDLGGDATCDCSLGHFRDRRFGRGQVAAAARSGPHSGVCRQAATGGAPRLGSTQGGGGGRHEAGHQNQESSQKRQGAVGCRHGDWCGDARASPLRWWSRLLWLSTRRRASPGTCRDPA